MPGLALAAACVELGATDLRWIGDPERLEARLVPAAGIPLLPLGLSRPRLRSPRWLLQSLSRAVGCLRELRCRRPRVVIALGGYAALLPGLIAPFLRIPLIVCEQNAWPGRTNRLLARRATAVITQFPEAARSLPKSRIHRLGNPIRPFKPLPRGQHQTFTLLVMGGSLAARSLNECLIAALPALRAFPDLHIIHLAGEADAERMRRSYAQAGVSATVHGFVEDMAAIYEESDLALCRAGATTVAECCAAGLGAIYVPLPWAAEDHQSANARAIARGGGAVVIDQAVFNPAALQSVLRRLVSDRRLVARLGQQALGLAHPHAAQDVAQLVAQLVGRRRTGAWRW